MNRCEISIFWRISQVGPCSLGIKQGLEAVQMFSLLEWWLGLIELPNLL